MFKSGCENHTLGLFFDIWLYFNLSVFSTIANKQQLHLQILLPRFSGPSLLPSVLAYKSLSGVLRSLLLLSVPFQRQPTTVNICQKSSRSQSPTVKLQVHKVYYLPFKLPQMTFSQNRLSVHELLCVQRQPKILCCQPPDCQPNVICLRFLIWYYSSSRHLFCIDQNRRDLVLSFVGL